MKKFFISFTIGLIIFLPISSWIWATNSAKKTDTIDRQEKQDTEIVGICLDVNGDPVECATVSLFSKNERAYIRNGTKHAGNNLIMETDRDGQFQFENPQTHYGLYASHKSGYDLIQSVDVDDKPVLRLKPWVRVNGMLSVSLGPDNNKSIGVAYHQFMNIGISFDYLKKTDESGHFYFDTLLSGIAQVVYLKSDLIKQNIVHVVSRQVIEMEHGEIYQASLHYYEIRTLVYCFFIGIMIFLGFYIIRYLYIGKR